MEGEATRGTDQSCTCASPASAGAEGGSAPPAPPPPPPRPGVWARGLSRREAGRGWEGASDGGNTACANIWSQTLL